MEGKIQESVIQTNIKNILIACSYDCKFVCVDDKLSKPFKAYLGKDAIYNFINIMIEESKYFSEVMKNHFNKELVMTKEDSEDFKNSTKCWICENDYVNSDVKEIDHCHITGKYGGSAHIDCNINLKSQNFCQISEPKKIRIPILLCRN